MSLTYAAQKSDSSTGKSVAIAAVVLLHLGFLYAFTHGLNVVNIVKPFKDTVTVFIPEEKKVEPPPAIPKPKELPPIDKAVPDETIPPPEVQPEVAVVTPPSDAAISTDAAPAEPTLTKSFSIKHQVNPTYPTASRRAGETGTVLLSVIVGTDGVPIDVQMERSSGFSALDQAAIEAVRKWRFKVNGATGASRLQLPITFKLEN